MAQPEKGLKPTFELEGFDVKGQDLIAVQLVVLQRPKLQLLDDK